MKEKMSFEEALARLDQVVGEMERENLPLDELLSRFKEGMDLLAACRNQLDEAQKTVEKLSLSAE